jgi:ADP-heptose:LPS heptosyltransferase
MISMDSGNGHLSSIYDIPTITIWGLTHPYLGFKPFLMDDNNQICSSRDKFPLIPNSVYGNKTIKGYEGAMRSISPKEIIDKAQEILS